LLIAFDAAYSANSPNTNTSQKQAVAGETPALPAEKTKATQRCALSPIQLGTSALQ
jgi:hypothetical protein